MYFYLKYSWPLAFGCWLSDGGLELADKVIYPLFVLCLSDPSHIFIQQEGILPIGKLV